ncbi:MAG: hypothetical protein ABI182_02470 [Candidatus Baltobacteraceae bacterium]
MTAALVAAAFLLPMTASADTSISAAGSTKHLGVNISVSGGGSFTGITQVKEGSVGSADHRDQSSAQLRNARRLH